MKNTAINTLKYTGEVTLSQYIGQKKYRVAQLHNAGGNALFNFLADCLIGEFNIAKANRPTKIMLISRSADGPDGYEYRGVSGFIYLLTNPEKVYNVEDTDAICRVRYSFIIPQDMIEGINSLDKLGIGLYSDAEKSPEAFAAYCEFDVSASSLVNTALVVDWELIISNNSNT
jgi:hypothetical protein